jgi:hypothetical protein
MFWPSPMLVLTTGKRGLCDNWLKANGEETASSSHLMVRALRIRRLSRRPASMRDHGRDAGSFSRAGMSNRYPEYGRSGAHHAAVTPVEEP